MITDYEKDVFLTILNRLNTKRSKGLTIKETSKCLKVSESKMKSFLNGKIFDFWLLKRYGDLVSEPILFWLKQKTD